MNVAANATRNRDGPTVAPASLPDDVGHGDVERAIAIARPAIEATIADPVVSLDRALVIVVVDPAASTPAPAPTASSPAAGTAGAAGSGYFDFDASSLAGEARAIVQQHGDCLATHRQSVRLEGNADERGSRECNLALGRQRAEAMRQALTLRGLPADGVEAIGYGEERPR